MSLSPDEIPQDPLSREDFLLTSSDSDLLSATASGDARAFSGLTERHLKTVLSLAQRMTGNPADADEIAQEAFLRLWRFAPTWDPYGPATVRTWLSRVVINLCLDRRRKRAFAPLEEAGELVDPSRSAFDEAAIDGKRRFINALLQTLPARQRCALLLAYYEDMKGQEIAAAMNLSVKAVESLLVRARRSLKDKLVNLGMGKSGDL